jgi:hypothetical protein
MASDPNLKSDQKLNLIELEQLGCRELFGDYFKKCDCPKSFKFALYYE